MQSAPGVDALHLAAAAACGLTADVTDWLLPDYAAHCEPDLPLDEPVALLEAASESPTDSIESLQPLASRRGDEAMALFRDERLSAG